MYPNQLIGKKAKRTQHVDFHYYKDASFIQEPIIILDADNTFVKFKWLSENKEIELDSKWVDNNWIECEG
ncbi:hypothetical protein D3C71_1861670 [compost metagenome]